MGRIAGVFPIGATGEEFVVAEWVPDPEVIAAELFKLANDLEDWTEPLTEARAAMIYDTELHFETQSDPYGRQWTALEEEYLKNKLAAGFPDEILTRSGDLRKAATSESAWMITERDIIFRTEALPFSPGGFNYGAANQAGTISGDVSNVLHKLRTGQNLTTHEVGIALGGAGSGMNLPQRMFIGADEDTIAEIEAIFVNWINRKVDEDIGRGGIIHDTPRAMTTTGLIGFLTNIPSFGGGMIVRGTGGRFIGRTAP